MLLTKFSKMTIQNINVFLVIFMVSTLFVTSDGSLTSMISGVIGSFGKLLSKRSDDTKAEKSDDITLKMTTPQFIRHEGYPAETHTVFTSDKYKLTVHRIPGPRGSSQAVFLQHGILGSSFDWVVAGKNKSLAFILSDHGYDVWMGNARGNTYSKAHEIYSIDDNEFWDFSYHEMGVYDLPAELSYVTNIVRHKIIFVGHSMGNTMFYVMAIEKPEIAEKVIAALCLSPIAFVNGIKSPIKLFAPFSREFEKVKDTFGTGEFLPRDSIFKGIAVAGCQANENKETVCANKLFLLFGYNEAQFNYTLMPRFSSHTPAGTSARTIVHFAQGVESGKFQHYIGENGSNGTSIDYDIKKINVPIGFFWSENDWLADPKDVRELWELIPRKLIFYKIQDNNFNHMDFLIAKDAPKLVYQPLISVIKKLD